MAKRATVRFALILCLCCSSFGLGIARIDAIAKQDAKDSKPTQPNGRTSQPDEVTFNMKEKGEALAKDGNIVSYTKYISSKGNILYESWIYFDSVAKAAKKVSDLHKYSAKDIRDSPEFDKDGQQVGSRVLVLSHGEDQGSEAILGWNDGTKYHELRSSSLEDVLAFEKQFRPPAKQKETSIESVPKKHC